MVGIARKIIAAALAALLGASYGPGPDLTAALNPEQIQLTAGATNAGVEGKCVALIPQVAGNNFYEVANIEAQTMGEEWGIIVDYVAPHRYSVVDQVQSIQDAIALGVDAICIAAVEADGISDALRAAADKGVTVVTWNVDAKAEDRTLMVAPAPAEVMGQLLVDLGVEGLKARGIDPEAENISYCWHYATADTAAWWAAAENIIQERYPNWVNILPGDRYYSQSDWWKAVTVGGEILDSRPDVDLILCPDVSAFLGQLEAAQRKGLTKDDITITGLATPNAVRSYCEAGILHNWAYWNAEIGAMGCYVAAYLAAGNEVRVGDAITIPGLGIMEVLPNDCLGTGAATDEVNHGVIVLPAPLIFNAETVEEYDF